MSQLKKAAIALGMLLLLFQLFPPAPNESRQQEATDITRLYPAPREVPAILKASCYDCHSNHTRYPWYARVQPVGWWLAQHVKEGKEELNFSVFGTYSPGRQLKKLKESEKTIREGSMPLSSYTLVHVNARLSGQQKALLLSWLASLQTVLQAKGVGNRQGEED